MWAHSQEGVIVSGEVHCFYHKQLAQEVVRGVLEGIRVTNAISVRDPRGAATTPIWPTLSSAESPQSWNPWRNPASHSTKT